MTLPAARLARFLPADVLAALALALACALCAAWPQALPGAIAAIAVAAVAGADPERWPGLLLATMGGGAAGAMLGGAAPVTALLTATARALEVLAAADMLRWFARGRFRLESGHAAAAFGVVALAAPALGALVGKAMVELNGATLSAAAWWTGDVAGMAAAGVVCAWRASREAARRVAEERDAALLAQGAALAELTRVLATLQDTRRALPVCGHCGDFRDDVSYWLALDAFRVEHAGSLSGAGCCPRCATPDTEIDWNEMFGVGRAA